MFALEHPTIDIGIVCSNFEESLHFYRDLLGMEVWADFKDDSQYVQNMTGVPGAHIWMIKLKAADGDSIELLPPIALNDAGRRW